MGTASITFSASYHTADTVEVILQTFINSVVLVMGMNERESNVDIVERLRKSSGKTVALTRNGKSVTFREFKRVVDNA